MDSDEAALKAKINGFTQTVMGFGCLILIAFFGVGILLSWLGIGEVPTEKATPVKTAQPTSRPQENGQSATSSPQSKLQVELGYSLKWANISTVSCESSLAATMDAISRIERGSGTAMQAYTSAHNGEDFCADAAKELAVAEAISGAPSEMQTGFRDAVKRCHASAVSRRDALTNIKKALDGDDSMALAQRIKDQVNQAFADEYACRQDLVFIAKKAKLPPPDIELIEPKS